MKLLHQCSSWPVDRARSICRQPLWCARCFSILDLGFCFDALSLAAAAQHAGTIGGPLSILLVGVLCAALSNASMTAKRSVFPHRTDVQVRRGNRLGAHCQRIRRAACGARSIALCICSRLSALGVALSCTNSDPFCALACTTALRSTDSAPASHRTAAKHTGGRRVREDGAKSDDCGSVHIRLWRWRGLHCHVRVAARATLRHRRAFILLCLVISSVLVMYRVASLAKKKNQTKLANAKWHKNDAQKLRARSAFWRTKLWLRALFAHSRSFDRIVTSQRRLCSETSAFWLHWCETTSYLLLSTPCSQTVSR